MTKRSGHEITFWQILQNDQANIPNLLLKHYKGLGISEAECLRLMQLLAARPQGKAYICSSDLQSYLACSPEEAQAMLAEFVGRRFIAPCNSNELETAYGFDGFYRQLLDLWMYKQACPQTDTKVFRPVARKTPTDKEIKKVYRLFEAEKKQPLSPTELEKLGKWLIDDGWSGEMLKEALSRAVMHDTVSFAYIDKILLRWQKEGISTLAQLETEKLPAAKKTKQKKAAKGEIFTNDTNYDDIYK